MVKAVNENGGIHLVSIICIGLGRVNRVRAAPPLLWRGQLDPLRISICVESNPLSNERKYQPILLTFSLNI